MNGFLRRFGAVVLALSAANAVACGSDSESGSGTPRDSGADSKSGSGGSGGSRDSGTHLSRADHFVPGGDSGSRRDASADGSVPDTGTEKPDGGGGNPGQADAAKDSAPLPGDAGHSLTWTVHSYTPTMRGLTYAKSLYVMVGGGGTLRTSPDGVTWTTRSTGTNAFLTGVTFGAGRFVVTGFGGTILTSTDGVSWTLEPALGNAFLRKAVFTGSEWVAVGYSGALYTSADGLAWQDHSLDSSHSFDDVAHGMGRTVITGEQGYVITRDDDADSAGWVVRDSKLTGSLYTVAFDGTRFIAAGQGLTTSPDGITWTNRNVTISGYFYGVSRIAGLDVVVGAPGAVYTSPDGATWTPNTIDSPITFFSAATDGTHVVMAGDFSTVGTSTNGTSWSIPKGTGISFDDVIRVGNTWWAAGIVDARGTIFSSTDATSWTEHDAGFDGTANGIASGGGKLAVVSSYGYTATSSGGATFTASPIDSRYRLRSVAYGGTTFVAAGLGVIATSPDGVAWTRQNLLPDGGALSAYLNGVAYGNGTFVVVGDGGLILTSADGIAWERHDAGTDNLINVSFLGDRFAAVAYTSGKILYSTDGKSWNGPAAIAGPPILFDMAYGASTYVAVGKGFYTSPDGNTFTPLNLPNGSYDGVVFGGGEFLVWQSDNFVMTGQ